MANDRLYELDGKKGHWYTDEQGNRYFVAQGQTPKEGWEATKSRKMIKGGKYVKDDGDDKGEQEISANEYQTYEADEEERFDETTDADFEDKEPEGFDRDDDDERSWGPDQPEDEIWAKFDEWKEYAFAENQTPENIEKGNKLSEEWSEGLYDYMTDDQKREFERIYDTADPDELEDFVANVIGNRRNSRGPDGTNGWKPSDEATPAYDVGGFYSINEGDRWEYDGGFVEVRDIDGENVAVTTQKGTKRITKDELSDMVKNAAKISASANQDKSKIGDREIPWTAGEIEDEDNEEYLKGKSGPQTANIDANVNEIAKEVASKFGEANVKVGENGHILLKDPEGFDPVAIADEDEIPAGAIVKIMPNWREPNENPDDTYFVKEDRGNSLLLWSPSKSSSFGGYTYVWPKNTMYVPPRMRGGNPNPAEGKQGPVGKQGSDDSRSEEGSENTINDAFDYLKKLYDDPETRVSAIRKTVEKFPNATNYEIGRVMEKLLEYRKGKK